MGELVAMTTFARATLMPDRTSSTPVAPPPPDTFARDSAEDLEAERWHDEVDYNAIVDGLREEDAEERATIEYLVGGSSGGAFSSSPTAALSAEDQGWSGSGSGKDYPDHFDRERMWPYLWWLYSASDPTFRNIVNAYVVFIRGGGSEIKFTTTEAQTRWDEWSEVNRWPVRERELIKAVAGFGEAFVSMLPKMGTTIDAETKKAIRKGRSKLPQIRLLNTIDIQRVLCDPQDPGTVTGYEQKVIGGSNIIHAPEDVVHFKFDTLPNALRGTPMILPGLQDLYYYRSFRSNRHWLNMVRSRIPLIITKQRGGAKEMAGLKAKYSKLPKPGSVWFQNNTTKVEFPPLNVGAADARDDAKLFLRAISQTVNLPEFIVSADASNANYSSTVTAENPAMQMFEDLQSLFSGFIRTVVARMMSVEPKAVTVRFPPVLKNFKELVDGLERLNRMGSMSKRTACEKAGFDWEGPDGERSRIDAEGGFDEPTVTPNGGPDDKTSGAAGANPPGTGRATPPGSAKT